MAAHRDIVTELKCRPTTDRDMSECPLHAGREGGWIAWGSSPHPSSRLCCYPGQEMEVCADKSKLSLSVYCLKNSKMQIAQQT